MYISYIEELSLCPVNMQPLRKSSRAKTQRSQVLVYLLGVSGCMGFL